MTPLNFFGLIILVLFVLQVTQLLLTTFSRYKKISYKDFLKGAKYTGKLNGKIYPVSEILFGTTGLTSSPGSKRPFDCKFEKIMHVPFRSGLREVEVTYADGEVVTTSMASWLTDKDIHKYFKPGRVFNVGEYGDDLQAVEKCRILK